MQRNINIEVLYTLNDIYIYILAFPYFCTLNSIYFLEVYETLSPYF